MDRRELFADFGHAPDIDSCEAGIVGLGTPDIGDLEMGDTASDGDGGMLGRVLIYASIISVAVAMLVWKHSG